MPPIFLYPPTPVPSGTLDPATTSWINAVVVDGGAVSTTQQSRVDSLITGLKADGLFTILDRLWIFGGESDAHQAHVDLINLQLGTVHATLTLAATGYTGDGVSGYFDTLFTANAGGHNYVQDSASYGVYVRTSSAANHGIQFGTSSAINSYTAIRPATTGVYIVNGAGGIPTTPNTQGFWAATHTAATVGALYKNGSSFDTNVQASAGLDNTSMTAFVRHDGGANLSLFDDLEYAAIFIGAGLTATQAANLSTRVNAYMTAWGINVY